MSRFLAISDEEDPINLCPSGKLMTHGRCSAFARGAYKECKVPQVHSIIDMWIHRKTSDAECEYLEEIPEDWSYDEGGVYSFKDNTIIVAGGCRAVFTICYNG